MAARRYTLFAQFYVRSDLTHQLPYQGATLFPLSASGTAGKNDPGEGQATFSYDTGSDVYLFNSFARERRICNVYAYDELFSPARTIHICTFVIDDIQHHSDGSEHTVTISGPSLAQDELSTLDIIYLPIGTTKSQQTTVAEAAPSARTTTVATTAVITGSKTVTVANATGIAEGDELLLTLNSNTIHVTEVSSINNAVITMASQSPGPAAIGKSVVARRKKIKAADSSLFYPNDLIFIARDHPSGLHLQDGYIISSVGEDDEAGWLKLDTGLLDSAAVGKKIERLDYSEPTANDLSQVMGYCLEWTINIQSGRTSKTALATKGATPLAVLNQIAETHGEYFYPELLNANEYPQRHLIWRYTCRQTNIPLKAPLTATERDAWQLAGDTAILIGIDAATSNELVNKVYVKGAGAGNDRITMADCSAEALAYAAGKGYTIEDNQGIPYQPWSIRYQSSINLDGIRTKAITIDIPPESMSPEAVTSAADTMLRQAVNYLDQHIIRRQRYTATCLYSGNLYPGDVLKLTHNDMKGGIFHANEDVQIIEIQNDASPDGLIYTLTLEVGTLAGALPDNVSESTTAAEIVKFQRMRESFDAAPATVNSRAIAPPAGGATYFAGDGIAFAGNVINVNAPALVGYGLTSSSNNLGINVAALVGIGLYETGNLINVNLAGLAGAGLKVTGSALDVQAMNGVQVVSDYVQLLLANNSGMSITGGALTLGTPLAIGATTTNSVTGTGHTHAVTAYDNQDTNPGQLWKTDAQGAATLRRLTAINQLTAPLLNHAAAITISAGTTLTESAGTTLGHIAGGAWQLSAGANSTLNLNGNRLDVNGNWRFTSASPVIDTGAATPLTLAPTAALNLNPGGDTIYQWSGNSEFRSSDYDPQLTGWSLAYGTTGGHLDIRSIFADEFHVRAFIAELEMALAGGLRITKTRGIVSRNFTLPNATGQTTQVWFNDIPGFEGYAIFDQRQSDIVAASIVRTGDNNAMAATIYGTVNPTSVVYDPANKEQRWTITWTYLGASNTAGGKKVYAGTPILDYGAPPNAHFIEANVLDAAASPYLRTVSIEQVNATTKVPTVVTTHFQAGALSNLPNIGQEVGMFAGRSRQHAHAIFTDMRAELHNAAMTMYAAVTNDSLVLTLNAIEINTNTTAALAPTADIAVDTTLVRNNTNYGYYWHIDEDPASIDSRTVSNAAGKGGTGTFRLETATGTPNQASVEVNVASSGTATRGDILELWGQVFQANGTTPITEEILIARHGQSGIITTYFDQVTAASWTNAQLRLRWVYIPALSTPTIKLDPTVPSIAVGNPLPTGTQTGGPGFWVGLLSDDDYGLRIGAPHLGGSQLLYDGSSGTLALRATVRTEVVPMIVFEGNGATYIAGPITIGTEGGIWQGEGTFLAPTNGLKIWREGNKGRLATFNNGTEQVSVDSTGQFIAGEGRVRANKDGLQLVSASGAKDYNEVPFLRPDGTTQYGHLYTSATASVGILELELQNAQGRAALEMYQSSGPNYARLVVGDALLELNSMFDYAKLAGVDLYGERGIALGWSQPPQDRLNRGQIISDLAGTHDYEAIVLLDTGDVNHGMTSIIANTAAYGALLKAYPAVGGLSIRGFTEDSTAILIQGYATNTNTGTGVSYGGVINLDGTKRSGTGVASLTAADNLLTVRNNGTTQLIVKGNGDLYVNGTTGTYDTYNDAALLRALSRELDPAGVIQNEWDTFVGYNRADLEKTGILEENMVNQTALSRLLTGAIWQLASRIAELEKRLAAASAAN